MANGNNRWIVCLDRSACDSAPIRWNLTPRQVSMITRFDELPCCSKKWNFVDEVRRRWGKSEEEAVVIDAHLMPNDDYQLDLSWEIRIIGYVRKMLDREKLMWNLSTLGGALSAMGDYFDSFADKAQLVSFEQLKIAKDLGDPVLAARCRLYVAHALAQKGHFDVSLLMIRREFRFGKALKSDLLMNCSKGLWSKVRFAKNKSRSMAVTNG